MAATRETPGPDLELDAKLRDGKLGDPEVLKALGEPGRIRPFSGKRRCIALPALTPDQRREREGQGGIVFNMGGLDISEMIFRDRERGVTPIPFDAGGHHKIVHYARTAPTQMVVYPGKLGMEESRGLSHGERKELVERVDVQMPPDVVRISPTPSEWYDMERQYRERTGQPLIADQDGGSLLLALRHLDSDRFGADMGRQTPDGILGIGWASPLTFDNQVLLPYVEMPALRLG